VGNPVIRVTPAAGGDPVSSNNLQRFREALMLSKAELARKAGLSTLTIDRVEAGRPCRLDTKRKILQALQLRVDDQDRVFGRMPEDAAGSESAEPAAGRRPQAEA
jgi:DNA-binding XRE family transcriptional regulator